MADKNMIELRFSDFLPTYKTAEGSVSDPYDCNTGCFAYSISLTKESEFDAYLAVLENSGATLVAKNAIASNRFHTYLFKTADGTEYAVHLIYYPIECNARLIYSVKDFLPSEFKTPESNGTRTSVIQFARDGAFGRLGAPDSAPGMGYVICLSDGSFILIDGGPRAGKIVPKHLENGEWVEEEPRMACDGDALYELLVSRTPEGQKPVIAAWFFTHAHSDHVHLACDFLEKYRGAVEVRLGAMSFPDFLKYPTDHEPNDRLQDCVTTTRARLTDAGAQLWNVHSGEKIAFPGCEVEILTTPEDFYPHHFPWGNHTSCAFRFRFAKKTFISLGDCEKTTCQLMADKYGTELKSDILQVSHHGVNGACSSLYKLIDPEYCFWPMDVYRFSVDPRTRGAKRGYEFNAWLRNDEIKERKHYHNSEFVELFTDEE